VYNFMQPGPFAANLDNFIDAHHLSPEKTTPIVKIIVGKATNSNEDFKDCFITSKNLESQLAKIRQNAENLRKRSGQ